MIPHINKILYATDLSKNAAHAFRYAVYFAQKLNAEIFILHIIEGVSNDAVKTLELYLKREQLREILKDREENTKKRIETRLKIFCDKEIDNDPELAKRITLIEAYRGYPEEEILKKADVLKCDAIIMGAHEKGRANFLLGTVAKRVLRGAIKPVIIVPLPKGKTDLTFSDDF